MIGLFRGSIRLLIFAGCLLTGLQVPSYVDQYEKRVDAHLLEVTANLSGFQDTANRMFDGNMEALIAYYENSGDQVFELDANSVRNIYRRYLNLTREQNAISAPWYRSAYHAVFRADPELRGEALAGYSYTVPLDLNTLAWGFGLAVSVTLLLELILLLLARLFRLGRGPRKHGAI
ncbi:MAG: DUF2937 family protein [Gammaproteobacteria bacterium]|nr:DUF2937 family protein [Pseudomonadales bacterium]MCP5346887.1 DUF2937 family protein [Pseudomonadales bacterium]